MNSQIESGWKGNVNGFIKNTDSHIIVSKLGLTLDRDTAWALCNLLTDKAIKDSLLLDKKQKPGLTSLGAVLGHLIDHPAGSNGEKKK